MSEFSYRLINKLEHFFIVIALFLFTGGLVPVFLGEDASDGSLVMQVIWFIIYSGSFLFIAYYRFKPITIIFKDKLLFLTLLIVASSILWSANPDQTFKRVVALLGTTLFGVYLAHKFSLSNILKYTSYALGASALLSWVFCLFFPSYGLGTGIFAGDWKGIFGHKNHLGRYMVLSSVIFLIYATYSVKKKLILWTFFCLSFLLVIFSQSTSALIIFLVVAFSILLTKISKLDARLSLALCSLLIVVFSSMCFVIVLSLNEIMGVFGKDLTLTGRTVIWTAVIDMIKQHPLLGYGYNGFWNGWNGPSAYVWRMAGWEVPHAHNGYLELCLESGLVGAVTFLLGLLTNLFKGLKTLLKTGSAESLWLVSFLILLLLYNISEITFMRQNNIFWVLYVATVLSIGKKANKAKGENRTTFVKNNLIVLHTREGVAKALTASAYDNSQFLNRMVTNGEAFKIKKGSSIDIIEYSEELVYVEDRLTSKRGYIKKQFLSI